MKDISFENVKELLTLVRTDTRTKDKQMETLIDGQTDRGVDGQTVDRQMESKTPENIETQADRQTKKPTDKGLFFGKRKRDVFISTRSKLLIHFTPSLQ